jgi:NADH-quinone oxidoreductase subunit M
MDSLALGLGILIPLVFGALAACVPARGARVMAMAGTLAALAWYVGLAWSYTWLAGAGDQLSSTLRWFPRLGLEASLGADNVSMLLVGLTVLLGPICVLASRTAITTRERTYYSWLLILQAAMTGVFFARDLVLFYVFFEFTLVPMYILINLYGSTNRKAAATKFFLYTFTGSLITLAGLVYVAWQHSVKMGTLTFDFASLAAFSTTHLSLSQQSWVFWALMAGFAVKVPLFPVHTWLPLAHTEAPTAGSVILAGVLLKLGTYGIYKFALGMVPMACVQFAPVMAVLSIIGILYAGLICWVQTDVKKLVAYSSVSHLGYCVLGIFALNSIGLSGSVLYMINHGLSTGALFLLIGFMYERYHTRSLKEIGGLGAKMPLWSTFMVFFAMASVGLPGLNGFISEFMCMLGAFQAAGMTFASTGGAGGAAPGLLPGATWGELGPWYAVAAGVGMIITAIYILYMLGKVVWGPLKEPHGHGGHGAGGHGADGHGAGGHGEHAVLPVDLTGREVLALLPLAVLCLGLGLYPKPLLQALEAPVAQQQALVQQARVKLEAIRAEAPAGGVAGGEAQTPDAAAAGPAGTIGGDR